MLGSYVNFTWSFSGDVDNIRWGITQVGANYLRLSTTLVTIDESGAVALRTSLQPYVGRVTGSRSGNSSFGQAIFTLSNIRQDDEHFYGCEIFPNHPLGSPDFDYVYFVTQGK